jgi:hypothetical protein
MTVSFTLGLIDVAGLLLAIICMAMAIKLVLRTEKELDKAAKSIFALSAVLVVANLTSINSHLGGIIPESVSLLAFHSSRILALFGLITALHFLIKITEKRR